VVLVTIRKQAVHVMIGEVREEELPIKEGQKHRVVMLKWVGVGSSREGRN